MKYSACCKYVMDIAIVCPLGTEASAHHLVTLVIRIGTHVHTTQTGEVQTASCASVDLQTYQHDCGYQSTNKEAARTTLQTDILRSEPFSLSCICTAVCVFCNRNTRYSRALLLRTRFASRFDHASSCRWSPCCSCHVSSLVLEKKREELVVRIRRGSSHTRV